MVESFDLLGPRRYSFLLRAFFHRLCRYIPNEVKPWRPKTRSVPAVKAVGRRNVVVLAIESTVFRSAKYFFRLWICLIFAPVFLPWLTVFPTVSLLEHTAAKRELLSPGSQMKNPPMITLFAVVLIIPLSSSIASEVSCNALFISHMDTQSSLF